MARVQQYDHISEKNPLPPKRRCGVARFHHGAVAQNEGQG